MASSSRPSASPAASATSALAALKRPRSGSSTAASPAGERTVNAFPPSPVQCAAAVQSASPSSDTVTASGNVAASRRPQSSSTTITMRPIANSANRRSFAA